MPFSLPTVEPDPVDTGVGSLLGLAHRAMGAAICLLRWAITRLTMTEQSRAPLSILLNGTAYTTTATTLLDLVVEMTGELVQPDGTVAGQRLGIAIAVDGAVVPRSAWQHTAVAAGQKIEAVTAKQGG